MLSESLSSFLRTLITWHCPRFPPLLQQSIDISCRPAPSSKPAAACMWHPDGTDAQTLLCGSADNLPVYISARLLLLCWMWGPIYKMFYNLS